MFTWKKKAKTQPKSIIRITLRPFDESWCGWVRVGDDLIISFQDRLMTRDEILAVYGKNPYEETRAHSLFVPKTNIVSADEAIEVAKTIAYENMLPNRIYDENFVIKVFMNSVDYRNSIREDYLSQKKSVVHFK